MLLVSLFQWWYGDGWRQRVHAFKRGLASMMDFFSIELLAKTLFSPFRQDSAGSVDGPLAVKMRAFVDQMISRVLGAVIRMVVMITGIIAVILQGVLGVIILIIWPLIPAFPVVGVLLTITGWTF